MNHCSGLTKSLRMLIGPVQFMNSREIRSAVLTGLSSMLFVRVPNTIVSMLLSEH